MKVGSQHLSTSSELSNTFQGPLSVTFACSLAVLTMMIVEHHAPGLRQNVEANLLITTIIVSMDTGTSEAIYLVTVLRFLGSLTGVAVGLLIQAVELALISYRHSSLSLGGIIALRLVTLTPPIYACVYYMKRYPRYMTVFLLTAINCPAVVLSQRSHAALSIIIGTVFGSVTAILTWMIFDRSSSEKYLMHSCIETTHDILSLLQLGLDRPGMDLQTTTRLTEKIQANILSGEQAYTQYAIWRAWLCSKTVHNFDPIYDRLRDLFFRASLLAIKEESDESLQSFYGMISAPLRSIRMSMNEAKDKIGVIFDDDIDFEYRSKIVGDLIQQDFQDGIILNFESLSDTVALFDMTDVRHAQYMTEVILAIHAFGRLLEAMTQSILDIPEREREIARIHDSLRYLSRYRGEARPD